jgi:hypothetical protein
MAQASLPMVPFLAGTIAPSVIFAGLSGNTSFSVLTAIVRHAAINAGSGAIPVTPEGGETALFLIVMAFVAAIARGCLVRPRSDKARVFHARPARGGCQRLMRASLKPCQVRVRHLIRPGRVPCQAALAKETKAIPPMVRSGHNPQKDAEMNRIAALIFGMIAALFGTLWLLQGLGVVHVRPFLCVADCAPVQGPPVTWAVIGAIALAVGAGCVLWSRNWVKKSPRKEKQCRLQHGSWLSSLALA